MAIRNFCGFETGDAAETRLQVLNGTASIQSAVKRSGNYALRVNPTGAGTGFAEIGAPSANGDLRGNIELATAWYGFWFRYATKPASDNEEFFALDATASITGGVNLKFTLRLNSNGTITAYDSSGTSALGTGSTVLAADTWYLIEVNCGSGSSAAWAVRIDGNAEISGSGANLNGLNNRRAILGKVVNRNGQSVDFYYDDHAIDDADYPPVGDIVAIKATGDGTHTSWTGDWNDLKELPPDGDDSYIEKSANVSESAPFPNNSQSVNVQDSSALSIVTPIRAVKSLVVMRRENNAVTLIPRLYSDSTIDEAGSGFDPGGSYVGAGKVYETDPNTSAAWTTSGIDALQVGIRRNQSQTRTGRVTAMYAMVFFEPSSGPQSFEINAEPGVFSVTGAAAGPVAERMLDAQPGEYSIVGADVGFQRDFLIIAEPGAFVVTGEAAGVLANRLLDASPGAYAVSGAAAGVGRDIALDAEPGSFAITPFDAALPADRALNAEPGSFALTALDAALPADRLLNAEPGNFAITGINAGVLAERILNAEPGIYLLTGAAAELVWSGSDLQHYELEAEPGVFLLTGADVAALAERIINAESGLYQVTGEAAAALAERAVNAEPGAFQVSGAEATHLVERAINAEAGSYQVSGAEAALSDDATADSKAGILTDLTDIITRTAVT